MVEVGGLVMAHHSITDHRGDPGPHEPADLGIGQQSDVKAPQADGGTGQKQILPRAGRRL
jgi:hypothetical protein